MISHCPHCGRAVAREEYVVRTRLGWTPTACAAGDGPLAAAGSEVVRNHAYWYCSVIDGRRRGLLMGPFASYDDAAAWLPDAKRKAADADHRGHWYAYGIASSEAERPSAFGLPGGDK